MANQYTGNFPHYVQQKFNKSAQVLLQDYANNGISYLSAAERTGFKTGTIRKWCVHYRINLHGVIRDRHHSVQFDLNKPTLNRLNFLYRKWPTTGLWFNLT